MTDVDEADPRLGRIRVFPVKSLDAVELNAAEVLEHGGLSHDREYAMFDTAGNYVNGKNEVRVHRISSSFNPKTGGLTLEAPGMEPATFHLPDETDAIESWLTGYFGQEIRLRRDSKGGFPDDTDAPGPTIISTATLEKVASWTDGIDSHEMRRRFRANLELEGVPAFWEDRLFTGRGGLVHFDIGEARFHGEGPCQRCAVPLRDPDTGDETPTHFRSRFLEKREETLPEWASRDRFDHFFKLMVNTRVPRSTVGERVAVGDPVRIQGK